MVNRVLTARAQSAVMRRLAACLIVSLALAAPATAQTGRITLVAPVKDAALRGSVSATSAPPAEEAEPLLLPRPASPASSAETAASAGRCRITCSQRYYFCLAGGDATCPQRWVRCRTGCGS